MLKFLDINRTTFRYQILGILCLEIDTTLGPKQSERLVISQRITLNKTLFIKCMDFKEQLLDNLMKSKKTLRPLALQNKEPRLWSFGNVPQSHESGRHS